MGRCERRGRIAGSIFPPSPRALPLTRSRGARKAGTGRTTWWRSVARCVRAGSMDPGRSGESASNDPPLVGRSVQFVVPLADLSLATSGDYRNFFERDGAAYLPYHRSTHRSADLPQSRIGIGDPRELHDRRRAGHRPRMFSDPTRDSSSPSGRTSRRTSCCGFLMTFSRRGGRAVLGER